MGLGLYSKPNILTMGKPKLTSIINGRAQGSFPPPPATRWREKQWRQSGVVQKTSPPSPMTCTTVHMVGEGQGEPCACVGEESVRGLGVRLLPAWPMEGKLQAISDGGWGGSGKATFRRFNGAVSELTVRRRGTKTRAGCA